MIRVTLFNGSSWLALLVTSLFLPASLPAAIDNTLSPYFHIKKGDSGLEAFPLKSTKAEVQISGVIANVVVTRMAQG